MNSDTQYATDNNLATRIAFHEKYTVPYIDFSKWVFDQISFEPHQRVLELGCGNGEFWVQNADRLPVGIDLTLTDVSQGMADIASSRISEAGVEANCQVASAKELPFDEDEFDIIIAKHMLYHVADRPGALSQIKKLLKSGGFFCASTNSTSYMNSIYELLGEANQRWITGEASAFTTENGAEQLSPFFESVEERILESELKVTDATAVIEYIGSLATLFANPEHVLEVAQQNEEKVSNKIFERGVFSISKMSGLFLCR